MLVEITIRMCARVAAWCGFAFILMGNAVTAAKRQKAHYDKAFSFEEFGG